MPMKSASCHSPNARVTTPAASRMRLKTVKTFATTMLLYERLVVGCATGRDASLRSASACVRPAGATIVAPPQVKARAFRGAEAAAADEARAVPAFERLDADAGAGVRRVDEAAVADVHPDVAEAVEEDEVTGAECPAADAAAEVELAVARVRQGDPEVAVDVADEAGAVEARAWAAAAVDVARADEVLGEVDDPLAEGKVELCRAPFRSDGGLCPGRLGVRRCRHGRRDAVAGAARERLHERDEERERDTKERE
jgi:hypothetical protein